MADQPQFTNRLITETSPYLLQHAHNPVDWYPWGDDAFAKARAEDKPVFLSIGYAACHWCHVMEHESFENLRIADFLNNHYVSIKVDREERPDLDEIYMTAVQLLTQSGGWPMTVFLTPDGRPFWGGTYFPPEDRYGRPGFLSVLEQIHKVWADERDKIDGNAEALTHAIGQLDAEETPAGTGELNHALIENALREMRARFDSSQGGFGGAPKFPPSMALALLLREYYRTGDQTLLEMLERTLLKMARGGLYDQLGGGFHRYSTDHIWLVPHFEKMLYDNALLAPVYFDAAALTANDFYARIGRQTLDYVLRRMTHPDGGFYSTEDADSEGVEGKYYLWTPEQVRLTLGDDDAALFCRFYDVREAGNWPEGDGASILNVPVPLEEFAARERTDPALLRRRLDAMREKLLAVRHDRVAPFKDDKIITSWNGMMISAMIRGAQVTNERQYADAAVAAAQFLLENLRDDQGTLLHTWRDGQPRVNAFLDDYAQFITALVDLYETTFEMRWLDEAERLAAAMLQRFHDPQHGGFFMTDGRDPSLIIRRKEYYDSATPSGNSAAVHALLRLGRLLGNETFLAPARDCLQRRAQELQARPPAYHHMLCALADELSGWREVAVIGSLQSEATQALLRTVWGEYVPARLIAHADPDAAEAADRIAILADRAREYAQPTAFVCRDQTCHPPVTSPEALFDQLHAGAPKR